MLLLQTSLCNTGSIVQNRCAKERWKQVSLFETYSAKECIMSFMRFMPVWECLETQEFFRGKEKVSF